MKYRLKLAAMVCVLSPLYAYGGGNPEFVEFPEGYEQSFTRYATMNRANQKQVAKLYANETAISSHKEGQTANSGSVLVMEIYKPKTNAEGKPILGSNGVFEIDSLAAVAVMEKKDNWEENYSQEHRAGNWGFAVYNPDGTPKSNDLACAQCHTPLKDQDYLFTYQKLADYAKEH
ncbi:conserved hypothetical protein [Nitrosococcus oceani ATCC 19707]|uniref:Cytochrome P460 domain-containing protein n=2 Tax=Nitrosococcus oceani TaxID=1229 RepID=Q3J7P7_NITOC|nr:cytochrome P460 family protein [Nitrosococcus oceani]ABA59149.1 conserved hypothetical protein [Nitrosococcus oceani ATCC 19707]EDZ66681.1 hypothetical protein NOC27_3361 [Nitrosococcus oceani AFC27]KFI18470.1 hypothetical protein IB75_14310 [Nitrosococcus oceani C-27]GEM20323.1 hypothetical protein NONS58_17360 [Nitrosococcus oceani]